MGSFKAYLIEDVDGRVKSGFVSMDEAQLDAGEVTIRVAYSSVNYKDALAATGAGRIIRRTPCVGGIDLSGLVEQSTDARFAPGDPVLATSFDIGVAHHGGYAQLARLPAAWVVPLPAGLSLFEAMALGTAGFTAALAIARMEENGLAPDNGPVVVSGASGGVGGLALDMLARLGYQVTALTGKTEQFDYLRRLGAAQVMSRAALDLPCSKPLGKALWAGAVDNLGGDVLAWMASTMQRGGTIASVGMAAGSGLTTTVMPFILRGVSLLGVDSGYIGEPRRSTLWRRLADDLRPPHLLEMTRTIGFDELPGAFGELVGGRAHGRIVVDLAGA
jgi:acrylyl-CoA reductase (NADPH)